MTPDAVRKRIFAQQKKQRARVLKALDRAIYDMGLSLRWKIVAENSPPGSKMDLKAWDEARKANQRAFDGFNLVRRALGVDLDADEPEPQRHWDAGA